MMSGKITRAGVAKYAEERGYEAVQIDGIPEGFSFKQPDITIGDKEHKGLYIAFVPLCYWTDDEAIIEEPFLLDLVQEYKKLCPNQSYSATKRA